MESHEENAERDERAAEELNTQEDVEPDPGEDPGPFGNPSSDEEALRRQQEEQAEGYE